MEFNDEGAQLDGRMIGNGGYEDWLCRLHLSLLHLSVLEFTVLSRAVVSDHIGILKDRQCVSNVSAH